MPARAPAGGSLVVADGEAPTRPGRPWYFVPVALLLVVVIALAGLELLPIYLDRTVPSRPPPSGPGTTIDLCATATGADCRGHTFSLPQTTNGALVNTTGCDAFASSGSNEILSMNYTVDAPIYAVVLPEEVFAGSTGWATDAFQIVANQTEGRSALWLSSLASGAFSESIAVPPNTGAYCIGWWDPSAGQATVQWQDDVTVTSTSG